MKRIVLIIAVSTIAMMTYAQRSAFDKFVQQQNDRFNRFAQDKQAEYDAFRKKANEEYADFMRRAWQAMDAQPAETPIEEETLPPVIYERPVPDSEPAPKPQPKDETNPQPKPEDNRQTVLDETQPAPKPQPEDDTTPQPQPATKPIPVKPDIVVIPAPKPAPEPIAPVKPKDDIQYKNTSITFYGTPVSIAFPKDDNFKIARLSENTIADAWEKLSGKEYDNTVKTALDTRKRLSFCDWAYMDMLKEVTRRQYGKTNEAVLAQAFLMTQSGYKIRLGKSAEKLYLLVASDYSIYKMSYYTIDGTKYYIANGDESRSMNICNAKFDKEESLCLQIRVLPGFQNNRTDRRKLTSRKGVTASTSVNRNLIDFFNSYPSACINGDFTTKWAAYANTPLDREIKESLYPVLRNVVKNESEDKAVEILLNWVQTAFVYGYDDKIWGGDRAFFPQETLFYPYSDCEDRAILFSRIVRDILGLDVVLLYYPGHLATAVAFNKPVNGDYLTYKSKRYTVCDPTYVNAPVGKTMPGMDNKEAKIIVLK